MDNLPRMDVLNCNNQLNKKPEDIVFSQKTTVTFFNKRRQITAVDKFHYNVEFGSIAKGIPITDDVWMGQTFH
jgi:hypothetical protein